MAIRYVDKKTQRFKFKTQSGKDASFVLIFGDEVDTMGGAAPSGPKYQKVRYRGRIGEWVRPSLTETAPTEMYFLDVGRGDASFIVTPKRKKILVDGGLRERALGFLTWKYALDEPGNSVTIDHLFLSHADKDHVEGLIPLLQHPRITVKHIYHNGIGLFDSGFDSPIGDHDSTRLMTLHSSTADLDGLDLAPRTGAVFADWIEAVKASGATYERNDRSEDVLPIGDGAVKVKILGPVLRPDGTLPWIGDKSHTINGNSTSRAWIRPGGPSCTADQALARRWPLRGCNGSATRMSPTSTAASPLGSMPDCRRSNTTRGCEQWR